MLLESRERAVARIHLGALRSNVSLLKGRLADSVSLCAVVKADAYGHGAVQTARAALEAGASWLGVATLAEAEEVRDAGLTSPLIIFGPMTGAELHAAARIRAQVVVWSRAFVSEALSAKAAVHIKFDSGMGRLGVKEGEALELASLASQGPARLAGLMSHFATADEDDQTFFYEQLDRCDALASEFRRRYPQAIVHAANSAATLREPRSHFDMVRCGIAIYGLDPQNRDPAAFGLRPVMHWSSHLAGERIVHSGESVGYGRRFIAERPTRIGIVPIGYADGVSRALSNRGEVLIDGCRCPIVGTISMDQLTVLLPEDDCRLGEEVVFIGESAGERLLCEEMAQLLNTINYEIVCGVGSRTVRRYVGVERGE